MIPVLIGVSIVIFGLLHLIPGDPARLFLGPEATPADVAMIRSKLGLDQPLPKQYATFMTNLVKGDLGRSIRSDRLVAHELLARYPNTIQLTLFSTLAMILIGLPAGIVAAVKPNSWADNLLMLVALIGVSMPIFWLGLMMILLFSLKLQLFPTGGNDTLLHFVLPSLALGLGSSAILARLTRSSMLEVIRSDFIRTARSKGLAERVVIFRHALRNAMIPIVTIIGLETGSLLGGAVLTETVFSINGLGRYVVQSISFRDYPVVQGAVMILATSFVLVNLLVDLSYLLIDPRIRYE